MVDIDFVYNGTPTLHCLHWVLLSVFLCHITCSSLTLIQINALDPFYMSAFEWVHVY